MQITAGKQNSLLVGSHKEEQFDFRYDLLGLIKVSSNKKKGGQMFFDRSNSNSISRGKRD